MASCGRIDFAARAATDGGPADAACTAFTAWGAPQALTALESSSNDWGGNIAPDGLTLYFDSDRAGNDDIYVAQRLDRTAPFGAPQTVTELDGGSFSGNPTVTGDQLEIYFDSTRSGQNCMYTATRANTGDTWGAPVEVLCGYSGPYVTADGLALYFNSVLDSTEEGAIYSSTRASRGDAFSNPTLVASLPSSPASGYPALSGDQLAIYYEAESGASGLLELWQATRASSSDAFANPERIPGIATGAEDVSVTADGLELFFATAISNNSDLYVTTRSCAN